VIGTTLGHYRIVEKLREGGMGVVYKAQDLHLDQPVALKVLPPEKAADPDRKRRFAQEAQVASALNRPNIVHRELTGTCRAWALDAHGGRERTCGTGH
jgi:serine/threonine protein kinase